MNRKFFALIFALLVFCTSCFASVDLEFPIDCNLALSEIPFTQNQSYSQFYPYAAFGPVRCQYIFDSVNFDLPKNWTFGAGGSVFFLPFQTFLATCSATYSLCAFSNGSFLTLSNILELGLFMLVSDYYQVEGPDAGNTVTKANFSLSVLYSLNLNYHFYDKNSHPYISAGFYCGGAGLYSSLMIVYGIDFGLGFRFGKRD